LKKDKMKKISLFFAALLFSAGLFSQKKIQLPEIKEITAGKKATVAVSVLDFQDGTSYHLNAGNSMPMLSVFKFHIALAALDLVDKGTLQLKQEFLITKEDLKENTYSPVRKLYPDGNTYLTLEKMLYYMVAESDNNLTDYLLNLLGGPDYVHQYIKNKGVRNTYIRADEDIMHQGFKYMYLNTTTSKAATALLQKFYKGNILSKPSTDTLLNIMLTTSTGANKLKLLLPAGTQIAHKTGSSGKDETGLTVGENDMGIIVLPSGKVYAIAVFIKDSRESEEINTKMIADISGVVYQYFTKKYN